MFFHNGEQHETSGRTVHYFDNSNVDGLIDRYFGPNASLDAAPPAAPGELMINNGAGQGFVPAAVGLPASVPHAERMQANHATYWRGVVAAISANATGGDQEDDVLAALQTLLLEQPTTSGGDAAAAAADAADVAGFDFAEDRQPSHT